MPASRKQPLYRIVIGGSENHWRAILYWGNEFITGTHNYREKETAERRGEALLSSYNTYYGHTGERHEQSHHAKRDFRPTKRATPSPYRCHNSKREIVETLLRAHTKIETDCGDGCQTLRIKVQEIIEAASSECSQCH